MHPRLKGPNEQKGRIKNKKREKKNKVSFYNVSKQKEIEGGYKEKVVVL